MRECVLVVCILAFAVTLVGAGGGDEEGQRVHQEIAAWVDRLPSLWPAGEMGDRSSAMVLRLSGEGGGVWYVQVSDGEVTTGSGEVADPAAIVEASAVDWLAVLRGELGAVEAFLSGKMRVSGDLAFVRDFYSRLLPSAEAQGEVTTDTEGWYEFKPLPIDYGVVAAPDASDVPDAPAGKHGFLTVQGDRFVFEDGTPARFWGGNIVSGNLFRDHETSKRMAARLARFGCNMVRFHGVDVPEFFNPAYDDTQHFSAESLDRLDYLIYQLKRHGIYINLGLLVFRNLRAGDGVRDWQQITDKLVEGGRTCYHFNRRLIELQQKYAHDLYTHVNTYTGLRYCDDPCIAMSEIINESSLFWLGGYDNVPASYVEELNDLYVNWAQASGVSADPQASVPDGLRERDPHVLQFLYDTQVTYFTEMRDYLRSIGVKVPIAGSNHWEANPLDLKSNLVLDYVDRHGYWDHPQSGFGPAAGFHNRPMVKSPSSNLPAWLSAQQAAGKPFIVSEWNCAWINEFIAEGPLVMAAYGAFQGWDGLLQYCYWGADWNDAITDNFNVGYEPHVFATWPAAARLFVCGHVAPGRDPMDVRRRADQADFVGADMPDRAGLRHRLSYSFVGPGAPSMIPDLPDLQGPAVSDTGQLTWDAQGGLVTVNSPASAVRIGFASGPVQIGPVTFDVTPDFAVLAVTALDDQPIPRSERLLVTATARAENSAMVYGPGKTKATDPGRPPILMEPVRGQVRVTLAEPWTSVAVYGLDSIGRRVTALSEARDGNTVSIPLDADSFWYEVLVTR